MSGCEQLAEDRRETSVADDGGNELLRELMQAPRPPSWRGSQVAVGELVALAEDGTALVVDPARAQARAQCARSVVDLHAAHIGAQVLLAFEQGDLERPIVMGVLRGRAGWPLEEAPGQVEVSANGERLVVSARRQLVLRCGKASITLTRAGKVLIEGAHVVSRSTGMNRLKGGAIELN
jgi:hypothetical protein